MKNRYKIAEIAVEIEDGKPIFWIYNAGYHASQGGMEFTWGNLGVDSLQSALDMLSVKLTRDINNILTNVKSREENEEK